MNQTTYYCDNAIYEYGILTGYLLCFLTVLIYMMCVEFVKAMMCIHAEVNIINRIAEERRMYEEAENEARLEVEKSKKND